MHSCVGSLDYLQYAADNAERTDVFQAYTFSDDPQLGKQHPVVQGARAFPT